MNLNNKYILVYHGIGKNNALNVTQHNFKLQIKYLLSQGVNFCSLGKLLSARGSNTAIVFDDALTSVKLVCPFLDQNKIPFGISVIAKNLQGGNGGKYLSIKDLLELKNVDYYSHSLNHNDLTLLATTELEIEINNSKKIIESLLSKRVNTFVYPFGKYNNRVINLVKEAGYEFGLSLLPFHISNNINRLLIPRINISGNISFKKFKMFTARYGDFYLRLAYLKRRLLKQDYLKK